MPNTAQPSVETTDATKPVLWGVHVMSYEDACDGVEWRDILHYPQCSGIVYRSPDTAKDQARRAYADYLYDDEGDYEAHVASVDMPPFEKDGGNGEFRWYDEDRNICVLVYPITIEE